MLQPLIYDIGSPGRMGVNLPECDVPKVELPAALLRQELALPEVGEVQVVRHFVKLSKLNYSIDQGLYPLGSCTMKYNPKINEDAARLPGFAQLHPLTDESGSQGALFLMRELQKWLGEISGFEAVSLSPAAGAQGEFAGILMIRQYHIDRGEGQRDLILVPNSAHGTNPATVTMAGMHVHELPSDDQGNLDTSALRAACEGELRDRIAGMMITVPSTLGLFETTIREVIATVHEAGGLMYMDGANMNALMAAVKPGALGFDVMHYNLHKTFSTPHGGGGPGSGAVGVNEKLAPYLPGPIVEIVEGGDLPRPTPSPGPFPSELGKGSPPTISPPSLLGGDTGGGETTEPPLYGFVMPEKSIGRMKAFHGNFGMHLRAYAYIRVYGDSGIRDVTRFAVLNANYLRAKLMETYIVPYPRYCGHEFVLEGHFEDADDIHALDISKRLMDYGFHPPTNYFPLIVPEALLIEPTETETKADLDEFVEAMESIAEEARRDPELLRKAPLTAPVRRLDEVRAAKELVLCCAPALPR
ncbi:MAG: aminomethyl-transferring glycine dehydrogenase subunit GcvPB [Chloroflexota bacterium]|nr:aminomethyl-transferring glycine dehydrogenase subunit GcvPB [Chloroflexota bacterium]MDE2909287.1 aminomethyl-transferring glycine dehydrogenase subunit GcvPB [Chloroflexota bacterium]